MIIVVVQSWTRSSIPSAIARLKRRSDTSHWLSKHATLCPVVIIGHFGAIVIIVLYHCCHVCCFHNGISSWTRSTTLERSNAIIVIYVYIRVIIETRQFGNETVSITFVPILDSRFKIIIIIIEMIIMKSQNRNSNSK